MTSGTQADPRAAVPAGSLGAPGSLLQPGGPGIGFRRRHAS